MAKIKMPNAVPEPKPSLILTPEHVPALAAALARAEVAEAKVKELEAQIAALSKPPAQKLVRIGLNQWAYLEEK